MSARLVRIAVLAAALTSAAACAAQPTGAPPSPSDAYGLEPAEVRRLSALGLQGDRQAIDDLVSFYLIHEQDHDNGMRWLERLGDLGDANAREAVIGYYENRKSMQGAAEYARELRRRWQLEKKQR